MAAIATKPIPAALLPPRPRLYWLATCPPQPVAVVEAADARGLVTVWTGVEYVRLSAAHVWEEEE